MEAAMYDEEKEIEAMKCRLLLKFTESQEKMGSNFDKFMSSLDELKTMIRNQLEPQQQMMASSASNRETFQPEKFHEVQAIAGDSQRSSICNQPSQISTHNHDDEGQQPKLGLPTTAPTLVTPKPPICDSASFLYDSVTVLGDELRKDVRSSNPKLESQNNELEEDGTKKTHDEDQTVADLVSVTSFDPKTEVHRTATPLPTMTSLYLLGDDCSSVAAVPVKRTGPFDPGKRQQQPQFTSENLLKIQMKFVPLSMECMPWFWVRKLRETDSELDWEKLKRILFAASLLNSPPDWEILLPAGMQSTPGEFSSCAAAIVFLLHSGKIVHEVTTCGHSAGTSLALFSIFSSAINDPVITTMRLTASHYPNVYSHSKPLTAIQVFDQMPRCLVGGWNSLNTGCTNSGPEGVAFDLYKDMPRMNMEHGNYTSTSILSLGFLELLHSERHVHFLVNSFITVSFTCSCDYTAGNNVLMAINPSSGNGGETQNVFKKIEERNFASWNIMLSLFVQKNINEGIGFIYLTMTIVEIELDDSTFGNLLVALSTLQIVGMLHSHLCKNGFTNVGVLKMHNRPNVYSLNLVLSICYITLAMSHGTQELVRNRINDGKKREAPNFYGPMDRNLSCGVSITSGIQDAYSRASISGVTLDKENGGGSVTKSDAFIKQAAGGVDWFMSLGLNSLKQQELNFKLIQFHANAFIFVIVSECQNCYVVAVFHRKMIDRGRIRVAAVLLKWNALPPKHGTWKHSSLRTRMLEGEGIVTGYFTYMVLLLLFVSIRMGGGNSNAILLPI